jgi:hypothetical protein
MKKSFALSFLWIAILSGLLTLSSPVFGVSHVMMLQAQDLVHKAWNPGGPKPSDAKRIKLLNQALQLMADDPYTGYRGHKYKAQRYIHAALDQIAMGDPDNKVNDYLQDAVDQCRSAIVDNDD